MRVDCIIQARMNSTRLPGKVLLSLSNDFTVLQHMINQLRFSKLIDSIIIATTNLPDDDIIEEEARKLNLKCFRGNSEDVLDRYYQCAKKFDCRTIIRLTSDCPLIDPEIVDQVIVNYKSEHFDYYTNVLNRTFPIGTDVEIFSFDVLEKMWNDATLPSEREHVTLFIKNKNSNFKIGNLENHEDLKHIRITLDQEEDFILIKKIVTKLSKTPILMNDVRDLFLNEPSLQKINQHIVQNEGLLKSLKKDQNGEILEDKLD